MSPDQIRQAFGTLRRQFEEASHRHPDLMHTVVALLDKEGADRSKLSGPPRFAAQKEKQCKKGGLMIHHQILEADSGPQSIAAKFENGQPIWVLPAILTQTYFTSEVPYAAHAGCDRFDILADAAWQIAFQLPESTWKILRPCVTEPTLTNRMWIGWYRKFLEREKLKAHAEALAKRGTDVSKLYVPAQDEYRLMGIRGDTSELWLQLVYTLAWRFIEELPLRASRKVWDGPTSYSFERDESDLTRATSRSEFAKHVTLPIEWFYSQLPCDVFLASVWAIDLLLAELERTQLEDAKVPPKLTGWTKKDLCEAAKIGPSTFDRIRGETDISAAQSGDHGRVYTIAEVRTLATTAEAKKAGKRSWMDAAKAWMELVHRAEEK